MLLSMLLSICAVQDLETRHIDIQCVFFNALLEEEMFMMQPPTFNDGSGRFWQLSFIFKGAAWVEGSSRLLGSAVEHELRCYLLWALRHVQVTSRCASARLVGASSSCG